VFQVHVPKPDQHQLSALVTLSNMIRQISMLVLLFPAVLGAQYDGVFKLTEVEDENRAPVRIPSSTKPFMVIRSEDETHYMLSLRLGNSIRASMNIIKAETEGAHDGVQVGSMTSTRMMPPQDIAQLEQFMSTEMPKMTKIYLADEDNKLILEGDARIVFTRDLDTE
jgi:heat shock protein HslJ